MRVISVEDWRAFRRLRLRALAESPESFGVTLAEATASSEAIWRERAAGPGPVILAFDGDQAIAMGGLHTPDASDEAFVWGMWVEPKWRGRGLGGRVLRELVDCADRARRRVTLHVTDRNEARHLYEKHGFVATGQWQPLRDGSEIFMETMSRVGTSARKDQKTPEALDGPYQR